MKEKMTPLSAKQPYESLKKAGYSKVLIGKFLPDWWDDALLKTSAGLFQFANILQNKLGLLVHFETNGELVVSANNPQSRFKHRQDTDSSELTISANFGRALGSIAIHCINHQYIPLPENASQLREKIIATSGKPYVDFPGLVNFCWKSGIPVLQLDFVPLKAKRMAGMVTRIKDRPVIILGYKNDQHAKQLFILSHELGHLQKKHVKENETLIDEDLDSIAEKISGDKKARQDIEEREADEFALEVLRGANKIPYGLLGRPDSPATLAVNAIKLSKSINVDPGHIILSYAYETHEWVIATQAIAFIPKTNDALNIVKSEFLSNVDLTQLSEENQSYLLSMQNIVISR
ncbi:ImmA/IrrE family metallo-endopeptidase [Cellvibrio sp. KY-GH-1]|uniref:ImmA/IrrE family metallo-endopeptidase n=1 Tax=Cellvibrio sp. KY-GH-1 TaxID=2303332 RepID=UPI0017866FA0|nr:ImmA/IrrE family metallo-endopeptidase [Cellvibrio sp. KY-GH-1]